MLASFGTCGACRRSAIISADRKSGGDPRCASRLSCELALNLKSPAGSAGRRQHDRGRLSLRKGSCARTPASVSVDDVGKTIVVCGLVVEEGKAPCPSCPYGTYSYLVLKGGFNIISYYWNFVSYDNACLGGLRQSRADGSQPFFVYGAGEGYFGSECTRQSDGSLACVQGDYFQGYDGCNKGGGQGRDSGPSQEGPGHF